MKRNQYPKSMVIQANKDTQGKLFLASKRLGCSYRTMYTYVSKYQEVRDAVEEARGTLNDIAESKLSLAVHAGEPWAIQYQLRMQAKDRGYVERQEVANPEGQAFLVKVDR
jgi:hypothetical protein